MSVFACTKCGNYHLTTVCHTFGVGFIPDPKKTESEADWEKCVICARLVRRRHAVDRSWPNATTTYLSCPCCARGQYHTRCLKCGAKGPISNFQLLERNAYCRKLQCKCGSQDFEDVKE